MEVIFIKDLPGVGRRNEVKQVSDGYARNFLLPNGFALIATPSVKQKLASQIKDFEKKRDTKRAQLQQMADRMLGHDIVIKAKLNKQGGLFAAINERVIAEAINKQLQVPVIDKDIIVTAPIKHIGEFTVLWSPGEQVNAEIKISVEQE